MNSGRELFERYLQAVKKYLPWNRQSDILSELRANLEAQIEDREEELGRPLTEGEMTDWLKELGSPIHMAGRYQPQQYLIGPTLFPMYWYALRLALLWAAVIYSIVNTVLIVTGTTGAPAIGEAVLRLPGVLLTVAAWVTLAFAAFEYLSTRFPSMCPQIPGFEKVWSPSSLPPLEKEPMLDKRQRNNYWNALAQVIFGYLFLAWLLLIPHYPFLMLGPGAALLKASPYRLAPQWLEFYWMLVAVNVIQLAWNCARVWRGSWDRPDIVMQLVTKAVGVVPIAYLLTIPNRAYFVLRQGAVDQGQFGLKLDQINLGIWYSVQVICLIVVIQLIWEAAQAGMENIRTRNAAQR